MIVVLQNLNYKFYSCNNVFQNLIVKLNKNNFHTNYSDHRYYEWLAGLIDGNSCFFYSANSKWVSLSITIDDKDVLNDIKDRFGGFIYSIEGTNASRYILFNERTLILLINAINGLIRNPAKIKQMRKFCIKYGIELKQPKPLSLNNGWLSGFIDSGGSIYFNEWSGQVFISITQKNNHLLKPLVNLYGGRIYLLSTKIGAFKYVIYRKSELFNLIDIYFSKYPLRTEKMKRVFLIKQFYIARLDRNSDLNNEWFKFKDRWNKLNL